MINLPPLKNNKVVFLAVGNDMRGDDAFGPLVLQNLAAVAAQNIILLDGGQMPESMTSTIKRHAPDTLIIADAACIDGPAGTLKIIDDADIINPALSTHNLPLSMLLNFLRQDLPKIKTIFIAAQAVNTEFGQSPCPQVTAAAKGAAAAILDALKAV